jgi:hypothetical protein
VTRLSTRIFSAASAARLMAGFIRAMGGDPCALDAVGAVTAWLSPCGPGGVQPVESGPADRLADGGAGSDHPYRVGREVDGVEGPCGPWVDFAGEAGQDRLADVVHGQFERGCGGHVNLDREGYERCPGLRVAGRHTTGRDEPVVCRSRGVRPADEAVRATPTT